MNSVEIRFVVGGVAEVGRAFDTIQRRAERFEQGQRKSATDDVVRTRKTVDEKERAYAKLAKETEKWQKQEAKDAERAASDEAKAAEKAAQAKIKAEESWARQRERIQEASARLAYKLAEQEVRAVEKAESDKHRARERWARATGTRIGGIMNSSVGGLVGGATRMAGMALTLGGGFGITDAVQSQFAAQRAAQQLINATTIGGPDSRANMQNILSQSSATAIKSNMSQEDVIKGALAYSRSARGGDIGGALGNMDFFAKLAKVSGTSIEDLGSAAGILQSQNADLGKDPKAMRQALLNAYAQTGSGSVSLVDAAKQFGVLGSTRGLFQGNEAKNQMTLMGLGQIAAAGGSQEEIGTYIKDFSMELAQKRHHTSKELGFGGRGVEALGVHFDKTGRMESPEQAIAAIFKATGGDLGQIGGLVGKRGIPLFSELQKSFLSAGGGDAGVAAVTKQIHSVTQSTMSEDSLAKKFDDTMSSPAERLGKALEELKEKVGEALMPKLQEFADKLPEWIPKVEKAIDAVGKLADWFIDNPFKGIGLIILGAITKDLASAAIGEAVKKTIIWLLDQSKPSTLTPSPSPSTVTPTGSSGNAAMNQAALGLGSLTAYLAYEGGNMAVQRAKERGAGTAEAYAEAAGRYASYMNPIAAGSSFFAEYIGDWIMGGSETAGQIKPGEAFLKRQGGAGGGGSDAAAELKKQTDLLKSIDSKVGSNGPGSNLPSPASRSRPMGPEGGTGTQ